MKFRSNRNIIAVSLLAVACEGCVIIARPGWDGCGYPSDRSHESTASALREVLDRQADAWNSGDLNAFMEPYWKSDDLTFSSGGKVTRGWEATRANYQKKYPNREAMGRLTFEKLEIRELQCCSALVLGRWRLERENPIGGTFSLVCQRTDNRWVIIHDHTSVNTP